MQANEMRWEMKWQDKFGPILLHGIILWQGMKRLFFLALDDVAECPDKRHSMHTYMSVTVFE